ncbi:predicted protein, partial [Arabidopsis lyrata subsp. lyrata]
VITKSDRWIHMQKTAICRKTSIFYRIYESLILSSSDILSMIACNKEGEFAKHIHTKIDSRSVIFVWQSPATNDCDQRPIAATGCTDQRPEFSVAKIFSDFQRLVAGSQRLRNEQYSDYKIK